LANKGKADELAKRLTDLIETKYMGQIMEGKNEDGSESSNGNGKKKSGADEEGEEEE
jgi:hypothetical protein